MEKKINSENSNKSSTGRGIKKKFQKSTKQLMKENTKKSIKEINPIPETIKERLKYIKDMITNESLIKYLNGSPPRNNSTFEETAKYLSSYSKNVVETYALLFMWISNNVSYDTTSFYSGTIPDVTPTYVYKTGLSISAGYAKLFQVMCNSIGLKCEKISGQVKDTQVLSTSSNVNDKKHSWNAIYCYGKWYVVDTTWGAGYLNIKEKKFERKLSAIFFLTPPQILIYSHYPDNTNWQLMQKVVSLRHFESKKYINSGSFYNNVLEKNIHLITHPYAEINHIEKELKIKIGIKNLELKAQLNLNTDGTMTNLPNSVSLNSDLVSGLHNLNLEFSKNGSYELIILQKENEKSLAFIPILIYSITVNIIETKKNNLKNNVKSTNKKSKSFSPKNNNSKNKESIGSPKSLLNNSINSEIIYSVKSDSLITAQKPKCFDNTNCFIYEPKNNTIKIGIAQKFVIKVKGATNVAVLDYKQFNYLKKRGEDLWEGTIILKTGFVSIVSQKSNSLFTEIHEFTSFK